MLKAIGTFLSVTAVFLILYPQLIDTSTSRHITTRIHIDKNSVGQYPVTESLGNIKAVLVFNGSSTKAQIEYPEPKTCEAALADKTYASAIPGATGDISCRQITATQIEIKIKQ